MIEKSNQGICPLCPLLLCKAPWQGLSFKALQSLKALQGATCFSIAKVPSRDLSSQSLLGGICPRNGYVPEAKAI